ncbi:glycerate kinase type-2 family protein [Geotoga petraea]|jgi:glycerate 2-kinase|uniref:Glycerate 2-kinase n=1 Tax=Geotoga petraea TaxID=28234 RepID=A0A1G6PV11_9BACT|nr:DUF4147 domain-containing protein [Geotoga petraea]SDC84052.1 glycerate 2-kinase [Geotoga petraea]
MIENIDKSTKQREMMIDYTEEILESISLENIMKDKIKYSEGILTLGENKFKVSDKTYVFGFGKSSAAMAEKIEKLFDIHLEGLIITKDGYEKNLKNIEILSGAHPYPDERTFQNSDKLIEKLKMVEKNSTVIFLISGGGSALFEKAEDDISLEDLKITNKILLKSGLDIKNINVIRKHISGVKGGKLLKVLKNKNCQIFNLIISDVENNNLSTIASGPTNYDESTFYDATKIIEEKNLKNMLPKKLVDFMYKNLEIKEKETLKIEEFKKYKVKNFFISKVEEAVIRAYNILNKKGIKTHILSTDLYGDSFEAGKFTGSIALEIKKYDRPFRKPCILISGGETTVNVEDSHGIGGPNKEFVLGFVDRIKTQKGITQIAIDTDGTDGPCDSAGAIGDFKTYEKIRRNYEYNKVVNSKNTEEIFKKINDLVITGPKESNLNDLRITIIE